MADSSVGQSERRTVSMAMRRWDRDIIVEVDRELDEYGQFRLRLVVDDKERFVAHFSDKREES